MATKSASRKKSSRVNETAESMSARQKEIAVSEFFAKNRHLLGFDNPRKALLTTIKEAVDNSLDACEEAGILPTLHVKILAVDSNGKHVPTPNMTNHARFIVSVRDNGPGIVKHQIPNVFGRLLYGSKFHRLRMSRGQQGIGISAAGMYGLLTTGQPVQIFSKTSPRAKAHRFLLAIDTQKNRPDITADETLDEWTDGEETVRQGTSVAITLEGRFQRGRASVDAYLEQTAIANPHAEIIWTAPDGEVRHFRREVEEVPDSPDEIKPHPYGVELGVLMRMLKETEQKHLGPFLQKEFSRVSPKVAKEIVDKANKLTKATISSQSYTSTFDHGQTEAVHKAIQDTKIQNPPTDCLVPIGDRQILKGLLKETKAEFYTAYTREPAVYRGNPFQIEIGIAFGGDLPREEQARVFRFANRVPLLYQPSACSISKAIQATNWRNYGLTQPRSGMPEGPLIVFVHMASVWVPFTSESKEAIADYDEIRKEVTLGLKECGRKLNTYIRRKQRIAREGQRRDVFKKYIGEVVKACGTMTKVDEKKLYDQLAAVARSKTETADVILDEDGKRVKVDPDKPDPNTPGPNGAGGRLARDESVIVVEANAKQPDADDAASEDPELFDQAA
ncbi:MAG: DNA topoisomerase VI subunit B [Planctomycetota bacterium]